MLKQCLSQGQFTKHGRSGLVVAVLVKTSGIQGNLSQNTGKPKLNIQQSRTASPEEGENLISKITTLYYLNALFSTKNYTAYKKAKYGQLKERNKATDRNIPMEADFGFTLQRL